MTEAVAVHPNGGATATAEETQQLDISIVMPCLNEEESIATCVAKARAWLERSGYSGEVLVVDNGSTDRSRELATAAGARVIQESRRGYGRAYLTGIPEARGKYIVMGDSDDTYDFTNLGPLIEPLRDGHDLAVGNRYAGGIRPGAMTWSHRYIGTPIISLLLRLFTGSRLGDSQCGLRAFTREAYQRMGLHSTGMEFASEMILKAMRRGLRIAEVPIPYFPRVGEAKLNTFRDGWRHLRFLLLFTPVYVFTLPGLLLSFLGSIATAVALLLSRGAIDGPPHWPAVFLGPILLVVGINALLLGLTAHLLASSKGITGDSRLFRLYREHFSLEAFLMVAGALVLAGIGLYAFLGLAPGLDSPLQEAQVGALAQSLMVVGVDVVLVAFLLALLRAE
ncbi:MAG: glycosyltransferase family 2 protein [Chloroflexota bacterium]|nr:glycosyltransferase family 2 protein [Chloroflexota bacterium]